MHMRVLFVCLGNICRSPAAQGVFSALAAQSGNDRIEADSAGTSGWHVGEPPYPPMISACAARGVDISGQRARQFSPEDFGRFDLIVAMDGENLHEIERQRPPGSQTPARLLLDHAPDAGRQDVPDPYYSGDYQEALDLIEAGARGLLASIAAPPGPRA